MEEQQHCKISHLNGGQSQDRERGSVSVLIHGKETTRIVGKLVKRRDGKLTYAKMQVGGGGTQAMGHVQAGSGVVTTTISLRNTAIIAFDNEGA